MRGFMIWAKALMISVLCMSLFSVEAVACNAIVIGFVPGPTATSGSGTQVIPPLKSLGLNWGNCTEGPQDASVRECTIILALPANGCVTPAMFSGPKPLNSGAMQNWVQDFSTGAWLSNGSHGGVCCNSQGQMVGY